MTQQQTGADSLRVDDRVIEAVHLLFMACLVEQQRGTSFRPEYINGSALELYFQRYTGARAIALAP